MFVLELRDKQVFENKYEQGISDIMDIIVKLRNERLDKAIAILDDKIFNKKWGYIDNCDINRNYHKCNIINLYDCFEILDHKQKDFIHFSNYLKNNNLCYMTFITQEGKTFRYIDIDKTFDENSGLIKSIKNKFKSIQKYVLLMFIVSVTIYTGFLTHNWYKGLQ